jgi:hypothetical protein
MENTNDFVTALSTIDEYLSKIETDANLVRSAYIPALSDYIKETSLIFLYFVIAYKKESGITHEELENMYKRVEKLKINL